ncbi:MAG TPA: hypothetical protein PKM56_13095 [Candidatus Rifleibacterium sp.]|nr:hypothetical protein [Candidatus Rifleibacterium sp.]
MPNFSALRTALYICLLAMTAFSTGCNLFDSSSSLPAALSSTTTAGDATMSLKLALPPQAEGIAASTLIRGSSTGFVKIILQVRQPGSAENKSFTVVKTVEVVEGKAEATLSALPAGLVVVKAELKNAHVSGWREFHGAGDLKAAVDTTVEISPPGSKLPADLLATAMQEAINNDSIMAAAGSNIATDLLNAVKLIDINSENVYAQVLATLIEQVAATGMVKLAYDNTARTITAFTGTAQTWQQTYAQLLGSSAIS